MYRWGLVYHPGRKLFVMWTGSPEVYTLDPQTWELALYHRAATGPKPPRRQAGVYSKWEYLPAHDVFVGVNDVDSEVWVYCLPDKPLGADSDRVASATPAVELRTERSGEGAVLRVCPPDNPGSGCPYTSLQRAVDDAEPGSVIVLAPGVYRQAAVVQRERITIKGEAGAHLMGTAAQGKGALVHRANDTVVEGMECSRIAVRDRNGSCIKLEAEGLVVRNVYVHDSEQGILGGFGGTVIVENSRFERNGIDGHAHGSIYAGRLLDTLIFRNNTVLSTKGEGHGIKSRARRTVIENNVIAGLGGDDSRAIDIPVGGDVVIRNNTLEKGSFSTNDGLIGLSMEREVDLHEINEAIIEGNVIIFDGPLDRRGQVFQERSIGSIVYRNNRIIGGPSLGGLVEESGNKAFRDREAAGLEPYPSLPEPGL
jgi:hypothetical protein